MKDLKKKDSITMVKFTIHYKPFKFIEGIPNPPDDKIVLSGVNEAEAFHHFSCLDIGVPFNIEKV